MGARRGGLHPRGLTRDAFEADLGPGRERLWAQAQRQGPRLVAQVGLLREEVAEVCERDVVEVWEGRGQAAAQPAAPQAAPSPPPPFLPLPPSLVMSVIALLIIEYMLRRKEEEWE